MAAPHVVAAGDTHTAPPPPHTYYTPDDSYHNESSPADVNKCFLPKPGRGSYTPSLLDSCDTHFTAQSVIYRAGKGGETRVHTDIAEGALLALAEVAVAVDMLDSNAEVKRNWRRVIERQLWSGDPWRGRGADAGREVGEADKERGVVDAPAWVEVGIE